MRRLSFIENDYSRMYIVIITNFMLKIRLLRPMAINLHSAIELAGVCFFAFSLQTT